jgi:hypothetical protein
MNIASLKGELYAIEIALDLAPPRFAGGSPFDSSGLTEPRICLVAALALTSQMQHIVTAVDRAIPNRLPSGLRLSPSTPRPANRAERSIARIQPMPALIRLQMKLIRAIEPGLAHPLTAASTGKLADIDDATVRFVGGFIECKALPTFEPAVTSSEFKATPLKAIGISMYLLGRRGVPQSTLYRWPFAEKARSSLHLRSTPLRVVVTRERAN